MQSARQDQVLVQECLKGNGAAWSALIDKYKNLIFSIPVKRGLSSDRAADIFQNVCLALVSELPYLREPAALPSWLIQTTFHSCLRSEMENQKYTGMGSEGEDIAEDYSKTPEQLVGQLEREQMVRETVAELRGDCRRVVEGLFYEAPAKTYAELAVALGIPKGSVGPTRMRCLEKIKRALEERGF